MGTAALASRTATLEDLLAAAPRRPRPTMRTDRSWYRITNQDTGNADIWIYDEIGYWGTTAQGFVDQLKSITASSMTVHINSPGGEVFDGVAIYNCLKSHSANVTVRVEGLAASAASFIAMAGDKVVVMRNAQMMIHDAAGLCIGDATDMQQMADLLTKLSDNIADIYSQRAGGTVAEWRERMLAETWYTGAEAVAAGLADEMTDPGEDPEPEMPEMRNAWDLTIFAKAVRPEAVAESGPVAGGEAAGVAASPPALDEACPTHHTATADGTPEPEQDAIRDPLRANPDDAPDAPDDDPDDDPSADDDPDENTAGQSDDDAWAAAVASLLNQPEPTVEDLLARLREAN